MLGAWVELAAVPAALMSITMLSACVWIAILVLHVAKYIAILYTSIVEESSSARERQNSPTIG